MNGHNEDAKAFWTEGAPVDEAKVQQLAAETTLSPSLCRLLVRRGLETADETKRFLKPQIHALHDPFLMKGMKEMIDALVELRETPGRKIGIHGDYDADGLTSTSLLTLTLQDLGYEVVPFVPDRVKDGYGVSVQALTDFKAQGIQTVLTCDTGISAVEEIRQGIEELGLRILVSDHHTAPAVLPDAHVIVNPQQPDCPYPFKGLCGVGVAYKIIQALCQRLGVDEQVILHKHLDLVAVGTICDVMPLVDENRVFVRWGLRQARASHNPGLRALFERIGLTAEKLDERAIGWKVGPRLNAAGRIDKPDKGLRLLLAKTPSEAHELADALEQINTKRREMVSRVEEEALAQAREILEKRPDLHVLALFAKPESEAWHAGLMGVVAPRVMQQVGRPVFAFAWDEHAQGWKGSGRTPGNCGVNLHTALTEVHALGLISKYGGHAEAAGVTILDQGEEIREKFTDALDKAIKAQSPSLAMTTPSAETETGNFKREREVKIEDVLDPKDVSLDLAKLLGYFGPFGQANQPIVFWGQDCIIESCEIMRQKNGSQENIELRVKQGEGTIKAIGWNMAKEYQNLIDAPKPAVAQLAFQVVENVFRDKHEVRLELLEAKLGPRQVLDQVAVAPVDISTPDLTVPKVAKKATPRPGTGRGR